MDSIKICAKNVKYETIVLDVKSMLEKDGNLIITLNKVYRQEDGQYNKCGVSFDDVICLRRYVTDEQLDLLTLVSEYKTNVLDISVDDNYFQITIKAPEDLHLHIKSIEEYDDYYRVNLYEDSKLYVQDMISITGISFYAKDVNTGEKYDLFNVENVYMVEANTNNPLQQKYALFNRYLQTTYNDCDRGVIQNYVVTPDYYYIPSYLIKDSIYIPKNSVSNVEPFLAMTFNYIYAPFNEFYSKDVDGNCVLWKEFNGYDIIGPTITEIDGIQCSYAIKSKETEVNSVSQVVNDRFYYRTNVGFEQNVDYKHLYQEENLTNLFTDKVKEIVAEEAPVIDMEKVKFSPYVTDKKFATQLIFNLHFRKRTDLEESWRSDMLYDLGFTDEDVKNQKAKLKKSFLRLSFYDSTDPLTQKLLYYSTIFVDTGELFGKYVKARQMLIKSGDTLPNVVRDSSAFTEDYRLDIRFVIKDEFNTEKSSEGFNIYYFPSDVLIENTGKTIYMKVEFNHAGFGRTIPFVNGGNGTVISLSNLGERLYNKLALKYINVSEQGREDNRYIYTVTTGGEVSEENNTITFDLYEPILGNRSEF